MAGYQQGQWNGGRERGPGLQGNGGPQNQRFGSHQGGGQPCNNDSNGNFGTPPPQDRGRSNNFNQRQNNYACRGQGPYDRSPSPRNKLPYDEYQSPRSDSSVENPQSNSSWSSRGGGGGGGRRGYSEYGQYSNSQMMSPDGRQWSRNQSLRRYYSDGNQGGYGGRYRDTNPEVHLSKKLSFLLRHGAEKQGFNLMPGGFLYVDEVLKLPALQDFRYEDVVRVVANNDKQRFALKQNPDNKRMMIRANQGHTIEVDSLELTPITRAEEADQVIHGTYFTSWNTIKHTGLSRMGRNHIHFAAGEPGENGVISGMRSSCEVIIILDMKKALADGLKFFRSANNVILSEGDSDGIIYPAYFENVIQRHPRQLLAFDSSITKDSAHGSPPKGKKKKKAKKREREEDHEGGKKKSGHKEKKEKKENPTEDEVDIDLEVMFLEEKDSKEDKSEARCLEYEKKADTPPVDLKPSQPGPIVPYADDDDDDDDDQFETASDVKVEDEYETTEIDDDQLCVSAVDNIIEKESAVAVCCYGDNLGEEGGSISHIMSVDRKKCYLFLVKEKPSMMTEGKLHSLLTSKDFPKVFHGCGKASKTLFEQFEVLLDGTNIYDTKVVYDMMKEAGEGNMKSFEDVKFYPDTWPKDLTAAVIQDNGLAERDRCVAILKAYELMTTDFDGQNKKYKRYIFEEANGHISPEAIKEYKQKLKAKQAKPPSEQLPKKSGGKKKNKK